MIFSLQNICCRVDELVPRLEFNSTLHKFVSLELSVLAPKRKTISLLLSNKNFFLRQRYESFLKMTSHFKGTWSYHTWSYHPVLCKPTTMQLKTRQPQCDSNDWLGAMDDVCWCHEIQPQWTIFRRLCGNAQFQLNSTPERKSTMGQLIDCYVVNNPLLTNACPCPEKGQATTLFEWCMGSLASHRLFVATLVVQHLRLGSLST